MLLNNVALLPTGERVMIRIGSQKILAIEKAAATRPAGEKVLHFTNAMAVPGLINSHDHLDFNCFSPFGKKTYSSYTEWGNHIHATYKEDIDAVLKIPQSLRVEWGMYKNLLAGVTTIVNHGRELSISNPLLHVYQESQNLHSVQFERHWKWRLNNPLVRKRRCVIHSGEGTTAAAHKEIDTLLHWNLLKRKLIGVHAVAMHAHQANEFTGLVWCPASNKLLLNTHADMAALKANTQIVFGTDSTLTGHWNIWQHLQLARALRQVTDEELFLMVTSSAAELWKLNKGEIRTGKDADIIIAAVTNPQYNRQDFFSIEPASILMLVQQGTIRLFDESLLAQLKEQPGWLHGFSKIMVSGKVKYIAGDLPALINSIRGYHPGVQLPEEISIPTNANQ